MIEVSKELKEKYDSQYSDKTEQWRRIGAVGKVDNILDLIKDIKIDNIVEVGAGDGNILAELSRRNNNSKLTAVEISDSAIQQIEKKNIKGLVEIKQFDGYTLPFDDNQFDLAICTHVIEHVEHPRRLMGEIKRISKNQLFEVPIDFSLHVDRKFEHFNTYGHINIYSPALFNFLLYSQGFEILKTKHALYRREVIEFQNKKTSGKYLKIMLKRFLWTAIPALMKLKPNTYTVLTK